MFISITRWKGGRARRETAGGPETVKTRWRSRSSGKRGRLQAKTRRTTCDDRTKKLGTARPKPIENQPRRDEKSTKKPTKSRKNRRKIGFGRFWALRVVPRRPWIAPERSRDGLRRPNGGAWGAKLAVWAAMLATVAAKLAAQDAPNGARGRPRALCERVRCLEQRSSRFFVVFWCDGGTPEPQFSSASAVFCTLRTKFAPNARRRRNSTKIEGFRPLKSSPGASKSNSDGPRRAQSRTGTVEVSSNF